MAKSAFGFVACLGLITGTSSLTISTPTLNRRIGRMQHFVLPEGSEVYADLSNSTGERQVTELDAVRGIIAKNASMSLLAGQASRYLRAPPH